MSTGVNTSESCCLIGIVINFPGPHLSISLEGEMESAPLHSGHESWYSWPESMKDIPSNARSDSNN